MDTKLTIRQIMFVFLFLSISTIFNYIPNQAVYNAGGTGYISVIYAGILIGLFAWLLSIIIKTYPNKNFYEMIVDCFGTVIAKIVFFLYAIWGYIYVITKIGAYSLTLQATLMPSIHPGILITTLFLLVIYTFTKNERTIFRFSEFLYQPILFFLAILCLFAIPNLNYNELYPVTWNSLKDNYYSIDDICAIGGNIVLLLFFCKELIFDKNIKIINRRITLTVVSFVLISMITIIISVGLNGTEATKHLSYPIFQSVKTISVLNTFERFDPLITMIVMMSDFVGVVVFLQLTMLCLGWVFGYKKEKEEPLLSGAEKEKRNMNNSLKVFGIALFFIGCVYVLLKNVTQFDFEDYYFNIQMYLNIGFQYFVPCILGIICLFKQKAL